VGRPGGDRRNLGTAGPCAVRQSIRSRPRTHDDPSDSPHGREQDRFPELKRSIDSLRDTLPHATVRIFEGQEHNAMDAIPQEFAATVSSFLLDTRR
jgi:hypothetical protein